MGALLFVNAGKGGAKGNSDLHTESVLTAGDTLTLASGNDTTMTSNRVGFTYDQQRGQTSNRIIFTYKVNVILFLIRGRGGEPTALT